MHDNKTKIYSRPRIRISKIRLNKKRNMHIENKEKIAKIFFVLIIAITTVKLILDSVMPVFDSLCEEKAKSIATIISNEQSTEVMKDHTYDELFTIEKDNDGNITMIKSNVIQINEIISDVAIYIQEELNKTENSEFSIKLGSFTGSKILSGRGPNVNIKISTIGNLDTSLESEFISAGVNQTLHRLYLQVECNVIILTPFNTMEEKITNQVLLAEAVIVGTPPSTYIKSD